MSALCRVGELAATGARGVMHDGRDIVVVESPDGVRAYLNACPHIGTPLETFPDRFFDAARALLVCSTHGARFRPGDGVCVSGPCVGKRLTVVPVDVTDGVVTVATAGGTLTQT